MRPSQSSPHPLSFTHRPVSSDDGLGDRNRSPSPVAWNVIGSTITPDDSLPSADSSFASNGASASFARPDGHEDGPADAADEDTSSTIQESQNYDRRTVEALLYDFAMQTAEGRAQIQLLGRMSPEDARWMRHHSNASQEDERDEDEGGNNDTDEAPPQRPSQYDSEIRERSRQVAASTMRYFGNTRNESASRSSLLANWAARRSGASLVRSFREAENRSREERL